MAGERFDAFSAGSAPSSVHPLAMHVMRERGIDISRQRSKSVIEFADDHFDYAITLCAEEVCPIFLRADKQLHWSLPDPSAEPADRQLAGFRQTADAITNRLREFISDASQKIQ